MRVPVISKDRKPLSSTTPSRARRWIRSGEATPFFTLGIFCVRLNREPSGRETQRMALGIDPGSKREAFTVKTRAHTEMNILADAVTWVKDAVATRRGLRNARRQRKTPYRKQRFNRTHRGIPPSTLARWNNKTRIANKLSKIYPITDVVAEDIKAETKKGARKWNVSFSPLEVGKQHFYEDMRKLGNLTLVRGYETFELRNAHGLTKTKAKLKETFDTHNVDSWVLANFVVSGHNLPDNIEIMRVVPIRFHRRMLHKLQFEKNAKRKRSGGTISLGFKKGSLVRYEKLSVHLNKHKNTVYYVGGNLKGNLSLHSLEDGKRLCQNALVAGTKFLAYSSFRFSFLSSIIERLDRA